MLWHGAALDASEGSTRTSAGGNARSVLLATNNLNRRNDMFVESAVVGVAIITVGFMLMIRYGN